MQFSVEFEKSVKRFRIKTRWLFIWSFSCTASINRLLIKSALLSRLTRVFVLIFVAVTSTSAVVFAAASSGKMQPVGKVLFDRTEVTIADFANYVEATRIVTSAEKNGGGLVYENGWERKPGWNWKKPFGEVTDSKLPAVHIDFDEAVAYCRWAGKRLPTDMEWQNAAYTEARPRPAAPFERGKTYPYPTGMTATGANCLNDCGKTTAMDFSAHLNRGIGPAPVATSAVGVNGLYDMGANVWEWTDIDSDNGTTKGTRGGSWWYGKMQMSRNHRATKPRDMAAVYIGFRCVRDIRAGQ